MSFFEIKVCAFCVFLENDKTNIFQFFSGFKRKHLFITTCIEKHCTRPFNLDHTQWNHCKKSDHYHWNVSVQCDLYNEIHQRVCNASNDFIVCDRNFMHVSHLQIFYNPHLQIFYISPARGLVVRAFASQSADQSW